MHDRQLLELLPDDTTLSWVCRGEGLVGWGTAARLDTRGPDRFAEADAWWQRLHQDMDIDDEVRLPGTGPVAFASIAFADEPGHSVLIVPEVVVGQRDGIRWITTIGGCDEEADDAEARDAKTRGAESGSGQTPTSAIEGPGVIRYCDGQFSATDYRRAVAEAVRRMNRPRDPQGTDGLDKVVLAHDLVATSSAPLDSRFLLRNLADRYPSCWTFAVDGLVGATPELLLERTGDRVSSRVLAGTIWPRDGYEPDQLAAELSYSGKDLEEHSYAVRSVADTLRPFCADLAVPEQPDVLRLHNVMHLATNVSGTLSSTNGESSLLRLVDAVHPSAAIGGTPTAQAIQLIAQLEDMDRERYTGPVGWVDADGNGELGIALRCAQIRRGTASSEDAGTTANAGTTGATGTTGEPGKAGETGKARETGDQLRLFAGGGIVSDSDPDLEVAEAEAKLLPMREAVEGIH